VLFYVFLRKLVGGRLDGVYLCLMFN